METPCSSTGGEVAAVPPKGEGEDEGKGGLSASFAPSPAALLSALLPSADKAVVEGLTAVVVCAARGGGVCAVVEDSPFVAAEAV